MIFNEFKLKNSNGKNAAATGLAQTPHTSESSQGGDARNAIRAEILKKMSTKEQSRIRIKQNLNAMCALTTLACCMIGEFYLYPVLFADMVVIGHGKGNQVF